MKKTFFIILLSIGTLQASCQQHTYQIYYVALGIYNTNTGHYAWQSKQAVDLQLTIRGELFLINDEAGTYFIRGEQIDYENTDDVQRFMWKAVDDKGKICKMREDIIKKEGQYTGEFNLYIFYNGYAYFYQLSV